MSRSKLALAAVPPVAFFLLAPLPGLAADLPVAGESAVLKAGLKKSVKRTVEIILGDAAIAAPFADPRAGSVLVVSTSAAPGQCRVEIALDGAKWTAAEGDGPNRGYQYKSKPKQSQGVRKIKLRPGKIVIRGNGKAWPCELEAAAQTLPLRVELRLGGGEGDRYCAAFGGKIKSNEAKRFKARLAPAPAACMDLDPVEVD